MFYTYLWLREDGTPYYVGKGKEKRAWRKAAPPKERVVIYPAQSEVDAFETEIALIWYYGRKDNGTGCLRNYTDGGEGQAGRVIPEEENKRRSAKLKGHVTSQETRKKISKATTGREPPPTAGKCGSENHMFGKHTSEKQKEAVRNTNLGNTYAAGTKNHTTPHSKDTKTLLSAKVKALWSDPAYREHMRQAHKGQGKGRKLSERTKELCRKNHNPESNKNLEKFLMSTGTNINGKTVSVNDSVSILGKVVSISGTGSLATITVQPPTAPTSGQFNATAYDMEAVQTDTATAKSITGKAFGTAGDDVSVLGVVTAISGSGQTASLTVTLKKSSASITVPAGSVQSAA